MRLSYRNEQWLPYPVEEVFAFFADPGNLPALMPRWQQTRIESVAIVPAPQAAVLAEAGSTVAGTGSRITLSFRPFPFAPFRLRWQAEIVAFEWNDFFRDRQVFFCDRQVQGPFAYWNHCHTIRPVEQSGIAGCLVEDHVEYELPFGAMGTLAHRLFLRRQIERTFAYRQRQLEMLFAPCDAKSTERK
jgi:ligand-binding SRPBCC domain-containing protein